MPADLDTQDSGLPRPGMTGAVLGNAAWLLAEKLLRLLIGVFVSAWVARYLGPQQFGSLNYALALVALFGILANAGLDTLVVRDIVREPAHRDALLGSAFTIKVAGGMLALVCALAASFALRAANPVLPWLALPAALALLFQAFDTVDLWFQSQLMARRAVIARNVASLAIAAAKVALVLVAAPLWAFAWVVLLDGALGATALATAYRLNGGRFSGWRRDAKRVSALLREGWPLVVAGFMVAIYMRIDQVMLGAMGSAKAVGIYSAAVSLSEPAYFIPMALVASAAPALARYRESDRAQYERRLTQLFRFLLLLSALAALIASVAARPVVALLFGSTYQDAAAVLAVHAWAVVFVSLGVASSQFLVLERLTHISLQRTLAGAVLNIVLNIFWIPRYGALGCAWATLCSYATASLFLFHTPETRRCLALMLHALWPPRKENPT